MPTLSTEPAAAPVRVSVIVPTYNRAGLLEQAIDSVLAQTFASFELIVVDDGSTDETSALLSGYAGRIRIKRQINRGVSAARNVGIAAASGEFIALLDSDDYWLPAKLARQVAFFDAHPAEMICQTEEIWVRDGVRVNPKRRHQKFGGMIFEKSLPLCLISPSAVMLRKSLLDEVGVFDERLPACEDYDLWLRITWKYPVHLIPLPLIVKRGGHPDQLSRMPELDKYRIRSIVKILRQDCLSPPQRVAALTTLEQKCHVYANGCLKRGRPDEADFYLSLPRRFDD
jgi:glycosyltransferase involved in cell wall biosynthesis